MQTDLQHARHVPGAGLLLGRGEPRHNDWLRPNEMRGSGTAMETPAQTALVGPYRRELLVHCYRMLGSLLDAEDLVQDTLLRAWEKRATLASPGSYRAWLYRIATNLCLNRLRSAPRRSLPPETHPPSDPSSPLPERVREPIWLEPFPDDLLADQHGDPQDRALSREWITLAFLVALQRLTPVQRAVLLLREVLEWPAAERSIDDCSA